MRSIPFLALLALPLASVSAAPTPAARPAGLGALTPVASPCRQPGATLARDRQVATRVQKLGEQPPASLYLAVVREVGGCPEPAIVRTGIRD